MKKVLISILTLIFIISIATNASAATTGSIAVSSSKDTIKAGDEFSVIVSATDTNNINTIEYTTITITNENGDVVSNITLKSIDAVSSNWFKETEGQSTYFVYSGEKTQTQEVFKITFMAESNITEGTYVISIGGLKVYSLNTEDDTTDIGTKSISVKALVEDTSAGDQGTEEPAPEQKPEDTDGENPSNNPSVDGDGNNDGDTSVDEEDEEEVETPKEDTTVKKEDKLAQTGIETASIIAIIALGAVSIVSYVSYRKYKNI